MHAQVLRESFCHKSNQEAFFHQGTFTFCCRVEVLNKYMSTCYTGASSALTMYTVAFTMSQDTVDMLWYDNDNTNTSQ